jgi:hypothetical protein
MGFQLPGKRWSAELFLPTLRCKKISYDQLRGFWFKAPRRHAIENPFNLSRVAAR